MKLLVAEVIGVVLCLNSVQLVSGADPINIGPVHVAASVGSVYSKYPDMTPADIEATNNGISRLEYLRRFIKTGLDRMPILDPYRKDLLEPLIFDGKNSSLSGTVNIRNVVAVGAEAFSLRNLEIRVQHFNRLDFEVNLPKIDAEVDFDATDFIYEDFEIDFSGHLTLNLTDFEVEGALSLDQGLQGADNDSYTLHLSGLDVINQIQIVEVQLTQEQHVPRRIPDRLIDEIVQQVANSVVLSALKEIDQTIATLTRGQIFDFLQVKMK